MAQLTSDIVWLVEQNVTLPNGQVVKALVPQLYVRVQPGELDGSGALIAGQDVELKLTGDLTNSVNATGAALLGTGSQATGMALNIEANNRQLHQSEIQRIRRLAQGNAQTEARLVMAACALVQCSAEFPVGSTEYNYWRAIEDQGKAPELQAERQLLNQQRVWTARVRHQRV